MRINPDGKEIQVRRDSRVFAFLHPDDPHVAVVSIANGYGKGDAIRHHSDDEHQILQDRPICTYTFGVREAPTLGSCQPPCWWGETDQKLIVLQQLSINMQFHLNLTGAVHCLIC